MKKLLSVSVSVLATLLTTSVFAGVPLDSNLPQQIKTERNLIIESVRVGYKNDITFLKTPLGKNVCIMEDIRSKEELVRYANAMGIKKIDNLIIPSMDEVYVPLIESLFSSANIGKLHTNINCSGMEYYKVKEDDHNCRKIFKVFADKMSKIDKNNKIEIENDLVLEIKPVTLHKGLPIEWIDYRTIMIDYKDNEILLFNNKIYEEDSVNNSVRKDKSLDCDLLIFNPSPKYSILDNDTNFVDEEFLKNVTSSIALLRFNDYNFKGYDTGTNEILNNYDNIFQNANITQFYSYKFNSRTTMECNGVEGGIVVSQEQIPRTIMN